VAYRFRYLSAELRIEEMSNLKVKISQLTNKKVPALALVVVAMLGMVAGVLAATLVVTQTTPTGEVGTYHNNTGTFTVTDTGLSVVSNTNSTDGSGKSFTIIGTAVSLNNPLTAGDWMDVVTFTPASPTGTTHVASLTFRSGTGPQAAILKTVTSGTWTTNGSSTGTITFYVDLGVTSITSGSFTGYITVT
jgi:hypothetical protein